MFRIDVLQNQWAIIAMAIGVACVLAVVLTYLIFWRQRGETKHEDTVEQSTQEKSKLAWLSSFVPWVLVLFFITGIVWSLVYVFYMAAKVPNW